MIKIKETIYILGHDSNIQVMNLNDENNPTHIEILEHNQKPYEIECLVNINDNLLAAISQDYLILLDESKQKVFQILPLISTNFLVS